jgi:hypothetical protein
MIHFNKMYPICLKERIQSFIQKFFTLTGPWKHKNNIWPTYTDICLAIGAGLLITCIDLYFSLRVGNASQVMRYDAISYLVNAKVNFFIISSFFTNPISVIQALLVNANPIWQFLWSLNFAFFGFGEWQIYAIRFWPIFLLMLLVIWVIKSQSNSKLVLATGIILTALLPVISVNLRATVWAYSTGLFDVTDPWSLGDLRPDLLFAVLLLWAVIPLITNYNSMDQKTWMISGFFAALAILTKPSGFLMLIAVWGFFIFCVVLINRKKNSLFSCSWGIIPFFLILAPWVLFGGLNWAIDYLIRNSTQNSILYSNPGASLGWILTYYWNGFSLCIGSFEGWLIFGIGIIVLILVLKNKNNPIRNILIAYLCLAGILFTGITLLSAKNVFIGIPFYFTLWLFGWTAIAYSLYDNSNHKKIFFWTILIGVCAYALFIGFSGINALNHWPTEKKVDGPINKQMTIELATDLKSILFQGDTFFPVPIFGYPRTLQYYMTDSSGKYPRDIGIWLADSPDQDINERISKCKAILVFKEDVESVKTRDLAIAAPRLPYYIAIQKWVKSPDSGFKLFKTYHFSEHSVYNKEGTGYDVELYVREAQ